MLAYDSLGHNCQQLYGKWLEGYTHRVARYHDVRPLKAMTQNNTEAHNSGWEADFSFKKKLSGLPGRFDLHSYLKYVEWIDINGDTFLSALLKMWPIATEELLLEHLVFQILLIMNTGKCVSIHTRDRQGNTPPATAACKGFRPILTLLLKSGANLHARDYHGKGVLAQTHSCFLEEAKKQGEDRSTKYYAALLSCITALVDVGAKEKPTEKDEWLSPSAQFVDQVTEASIVREDVDFL